MKPKLIKKSIDPLVEIEPLLRKMLQNLKQDMILGVNTCGMKLTRLEYSILHILSNQANEHTTITAISELMDVEPPTLVGAIAKLERKKLISKTRDPNDRRRMPLVITASGTSLIRKILEPMNRSLAKAFARIGEQKTKQFLALLNEIIADRLS